MEFNNDNANVVITLGNDTYYLFAGFGVTNTQQSGWAIKKVVTSAITVNGVTGTRKISYWASGSCNYDKVANNYASYPYKMMTV